MARNTRGQGPRRRTEKIIGVFNDTATTSSGDIVLHTAEDSKTLVRAIITIRSVAVSGAPTYNYTLQRAPNSTSVYNAITGNDLDKPTSDEHVAHVTGLFLANSTEPMTDVIDTKSMRKMSEADTLVLSHKANVASGVTFSGSYTLIFKE